MATDYASVFSAVAAGFSALTAALVYWREWGLRRPYCLPPRCYWVGYMEGEKSEPRMCIALPIHVVSLGGLSSVIEDMMLEVETEGWGKSLWFQPELQTNIETARGTSWGDMDAFVPLVAGGKNVATFVVVFGRRVFKDDPTVSWYSGEYRVVAEETTSRRRLFEIAFELPSNFVHGDEKQLTVKAGKDKDIALSRRYWTREILDERDSRGGSYKGQTMSVRSHSTGAIR